MFKLYAMGDSGQLDIFLNDLKSNQKYDVKIEEKQHYDSEKKREKVTMSVDVQPVPPTVKTGKPAATNESIKSAKPTAPTTVSLQTTTGKIDIDFLKKMVVEVEPGMHIISGYTFDIFS